MGDLSQHFDKAEFRCRHCGVVKTPPSTFIAKLEALRRRAGRALPVLSGYRCAVHNRAVGGKRFSRHRVGDAADIPEGLVHSDQAVAAGMRGVGVRNGWVVHVDDRPRRTALIFADP